LIPTEFPDEHECQIEVAAAEAERDGQQNRCAGGEGDPAWQTPNRTFGRRSVKGDLRHRRIPGDHKDRNPHPGAQATHPVMGSVRTDAYPRRARGRSTNYGGLDRKDRLRELQVHAAGTGEPGHNDVRGGLRATLARSSGSDTAIRLNFELSQFIDHGGVSQALGRPQVRRRSARISLIF
jgi:hypothetical protein